MSDNNAPGGPLRALVTAAAVIIVVAGLDAAADVLLPLLLSGFLSIIALPVVRGLRRAGLPNVVAILIVVFAVAGLLVLFTAIVATTVGRFTSALPRYEPQLEELMTLGLAQLEQLGISTDAQNLSDLLEPTYIMVVVGQTVNALAAVVSRLLIVTVTMTFMLLEAQELAVKLKVAFGEEDGPGGALGQVSEKVQRYLLIKTLVSIATGVLAGTWVWALGLDFPVLWGLLAFLLNYIPSIGSIVAAVPPVLLAMVQLGPGYAVAVALGYAVVNVTLGNFLEPRFLGRSLGLSPLVIFLSLLFWGWVWGPVGMLFCVPMTVIAKVVLESQEDTLWLAVLLGSSADVAEYRTARGAAPV